MNESEKVPGSLRDTPSDYVFGSKIPVKCTPQRARVFQVAIPTRGWALLDSAAKALAEGDVVAMIRCYESLKGYSL